MRQKRTPVDIDVNTGVASVEQDALMSPNPRGKLEDLVAGCVCAV